MRVTIKEFYLVSDTDGEGYPTSGIALFPLESAARKSIEGNGYKSISKRRCIVLDGDCFLIKSEVNKERVRDKFADLSVSRAFKIQGVEKEYRYGRSDFVDDFHSAVTLNELIKERIHFHKNIESITPYFLFRDGNNYWTVENERPLAAQSIKESRENAIEFALAKLT